MEHESFIWSWLTYGWLVQNLGIIIVILLLGIVILFIFPILLGYDIKKEAAKKEINQKEFNKD
ncbi:MAG: hypothetical protein CMG24_06640 [Candidatus Marinimicrobia bacterium]|nr:hypothetical protein [Candidatus Neomarinimicrobiota bacterium]|tara:strand:+ start:1149 stop:1337 length:189 start_codon:yes stop_codon:yes gene_type:complete